MGDPGGKRELDCSSNSVYWTDPRLLCPLPPKSHQILHHDPPLNSKYIQYVYRKGYLKICKNLPIDFKHTGLAPLSIPQDTKKNDANCYTFIEQTK